jgi:hypothetical protein
MATALVCVMAVLVTAIYADGCSLVRHFGRSTAKGSIFKKSLGPKSLTHSAA